jgi:galactose oxidase-like protein/PKD domain-containing protein/glyoxal oxidase-like protein/Big-like domain-containing protein
MYVRSPGYLVRILAALSISLLLSPSVRLSRLLAQSPVDVGEWRTLPYLMPINPIHAGILHTGKVVVVAGSENEPGKHGVSSKAAVYDYQAGTIVVQELQWDLFCNGMAFLPDGRLLIIGGTEQYDPFYGDSRASIFDPLTEKFIEVESMAHGRWYASGTTLADGRIMAFSGLNETSSTNNAVEMYRIGTGWGPPATAPWTPPLYPWLHLLPSGKIFYSGSTASSHLFDPATLAWTLNIAQTNYNTDRSYGTSVLLPLLPALGYKPRVMILGGHNPSVNTTEVIDLSQPVPAWQWAASMSEPRIQMNATILPDGKVLALGGSLNNEDTGSASLAADLYDPSSDTMVPAGVEAYPRLYHSVSILLPDATVWVAGSNPQRGTYEPHMEIYRPRYLFTTDGSGQAIAAPRPSITSAPPVVGYGATFTVLTPDASDIGSVAFLRPGSPTHAFDMEQRMVGLAFTASSATSLAVTAPPSANLAPPGYYMLFILNRAGTPSVAAFVQLLAAPQNQPPRGTILAPAGDVAIRAGQSVNFSGTGSDPEGSALTYSWIFPDGSPDASGAQNPSVVFPTPGTYVVSLTVLDGQGANDPSPPTRTITVSPATLAVAITAPAAGATVKGSVNYAAQVSGGVAPFTFNFLADGKVIATKVVSTASAKITWNTRKTPNGSRTLVVSARDSGGNTASASETVTVRN